MSALVRGESATRKALIVNAPSSPRRRGSTGSTNSLDSRLRGNDVEVKRE